MVPVAGMLVPLTVSVKAAWPAVTVLGFSAVMAGAALMVKVAGPESALFGPLTLTVAVPAGVIKLAGTAAVNWVALPYVVVRSEPFHVTVIWLVKLVPLTVRVKPGAVAVREAGLRELMVGFAPMMKLTALE